MSSFTDFLRWYNNRDVAPTLEAMQKNDCFSPRQRYRYVKAWLYFTKPGQHSLTQTYWCKILSIHGRRYRFLEKNREDVVGCPSIVFTWKAIVNETFNRKTTNLCKSIVGIDASQLYHYSMCQPMPTGLNTRSDFDSDTAIFIPRQNKTRSFENMVMSYFQRTWPECEIEIFFTTGRQKKIDFFSVDEFCSHCNTVFEVVGCIYHFCPCQELRRSLTEEDLQRSSKKKEFNALTRHYIQKKGYKVIEKWECEWWRLYKTTKNVEQHIREHFPYRCSLAAEQLLEAIKQGKLFGHVQFDIEVPENLRANFANFPPFFKNTLVSKSDIGDLMKNYAEEEKFLSQPQKLLISSFTLQNGTLITLLLLFYVQLGLVSTKIHRFVEYTPKTCFNRVVQAAVDARRKGGENPNSSVVAKTMNLLANSSYGYQIIDRSRPLQRSASLTKKHMRPVIVNCSKN